MISHSTRASQTPFGPRTPSPGLRYHYPISQDGSKQEVDTDIVIYGGTPAGVSAALQARRMGRRVSLLVFGRHIGGMTAGGLGATDVGHGQAIGGISREFYTLIGEHYGKPLSWRFEPHVAEGIFNRLLADAGVEVHFEQRLARVEVEHKRITKARMICGGTYKARMFIDASYEGDLMAMAGVSHTVGRESNRRYRETLNGIHFGHPGHNFTAWVDPYVIPGDPGSGLLVGIQDLPPGQNGQSDSCIQAYNFRVCLTDVPDNRLPFPKSVGYDAGRYELLLRYIRAGVWDALFLTLAIPNHKTDTNNYGGFSSDHIGANYDWPEGSYDTRERIFQDHVSYNQGMYYFLANDRRVPVAIRDEVNAWGLPKDEFTETGGWPHELYVREARRMVGDVVMTEHHCRHREQVEDPIGLAAYTMDSHNCRRLVMDGRVYNEGNVEVPPSAPYSISYRAIIPAKGECENLLVPWCLSASHIAFGSIRMEPVGMILGQSAATAACLAIDQNSGTHDVEYTALRDRLLADRQVLNWSENQTQTGINQWIESDRPDAVNAALAVD
jgi:FAD dependent oxidoreductase